MVNFVQLSSLGVSNALPCTGLAKTTMVQLTLGGSAAGTSSADVTVQVTMDNLSTQISGTQTFIPSWSNISTTHYSSTTLTATDGVTVTLLSPVAGLRISSSTGSWTTSNFVVLKMLQSLG